MNRNLFLLTLLLLPFGLFASSTDDLAKSKGMDQDVIVSLSPVPAQTDVPRYVIIEAAFTVPLDPASVQKNNIKLTFLSSQTNEHIDGKIGYDDAERKVIFTPNAPLEPGMYEVEIKSLKADKAHKSTKINEIKYRFIVVKELLQSISIIPNAIDAKEGTTLQLSAIGHYDNGNEKNLTTEVDWLVDDPQFAAVDANGTLSALKEGMTTLLVSMNTIESSASLTVFKEINGHRLPPEPDPVLNNSTLLGIDSNHNDVRDDVERWIYETYQDKHPIYIEIALQAARAYKKVLETPEKAKEIREEVNGAYYCNSYYQNYAQYFQKPTLVHERIDAKVKSKYFNTQNRKDLYNLYDSLLSGDSYALPKISAMKEHCDFNTAQFE